MLWHLIVLFTHGKMHLKLVEKYISSVQAIVSFAPNANGLQSQENTSRTFIQFCWTQTSFIYKCKRQKTKNTFSHSMYIENEVWNEKAKRKEAKRSKNCAQHLNYRQNGDNSIHYALFPILLSNRKESTPPNKYALAQRYNTNECLRVTDSSTEY